jgi:hypothetical protein
MRKVNKIYKERLTNKNIKCRFNDIKFSKQRNIFYLYNLDNFNYSNHYFYYHCISHKYNAYVKHYCYQTFNHKGYIHSFKNSGSYKPASTFYSRKHGHERYMFYKNGKFLFSDIYKKYQQL